MNPIDLLKKALPKPPQSPEDLRETVHAAATLHYRATSLKAEQDTAIAAVKKTYGGELAGLGKRFRSLVQVIAAWAGQHRDEAFAGKQTLDVDGHKLRFRKSTGKVTCPLPDADAVDLILATGDDELIAAAINPNPSPDLKGIRALLESGGAPAEVLKGIGFRLEFPETFSFEPAEQKTDTTTL